MPSENDEPPVEVSIEPGADENGDPVLVLGGELDTANASTFEAAVASVAAHDPRRLTFDLRGLRFIDSAGIAILVALAAKVEVRLRNPSPIVRRVIEATGLTDVLRMQE